MYRRWSNFRKELKVINKSLANSKEGIAMLVIICLALMLTPIAFKKWIGSICYLDVFLIYSMDRRLIIVPFAILAIMFFLKNDFNQNNVIRYKSIRTIWINTVKKICLISLYVAVITVLIAGVCGKFMSDCDFNWNKPFTFFWSTTNGKTIESVSYPIVVLILFTSIFFTVLICGLVYFLMYWLTGSSILGVVTVLAICVFGYSEENLFHKYISADTEVWLNNIDWSAQILLPIGICTLIIMAGYLLVKNKQFGIERDKKWIKLIKNQIQ